MVQMDPDLLNSIGLPPSGPVSENSTGQCTPGFPDYFICVVSHWVHRETCQAVCQC